MILKQFDKFIQIHEKYDPNIILPILENIESFFENPETVFKDDATSTVILIHIKNQPFVIKRANTKNKIHFLRRAIQKSRAQKNWQNALKLHALGINSIFPTALLEERWGPFKGRSYFICPYIEGIDALHFFACGAKPKDSWPLVAKNISEMIHLLAKNQISHRDLNLSNILLVQNQPFLLDLDAMSAYRFKLFASWAANKEKKRFLLNWQLVPQANKHAEHLFKQLLN